MTDLEKTITLKKGIGLAICMLIGTGILALPGLALSMGNVHETILGWLLITFVTIPRVQICSRLGLRFPSTSGLAGYAEKAVGPGAGIRSLILQAVLTFLGFLLSLLLAVNICGSFLISPNWEEPFVQSFL